MSRKIDDILAVIDAGLQSSNEHGYGDDDFPDWCARCQRHAPADDGDLCAGCRAFLLEDTDVDPATVDLVRVESSDQARRAEWVAALARVYGIPDEMLVSHTEWRGARASNMWVDDPIRVSDELPIVRAPRGEIAYPAVVNPEDFGPQGRDEEPRRRVVLHMPRQHGRSAILDRLADDLERHVPPPGQPNRVVMQRRTVEHLAASMGWDVRLAAESMRALGRAFNALIDIIDDLPEDTPDDV